MLLHISGTSPLSQLNQNLLCNPHSTTSPRASPNISLTNSSQLTPSPIEENDNNNNNVDEGFENDNISVTGSPAHANSGEDDDKRSPTPPPTGGAFTSLIQRNTPFKKTDFLSGFATHIHQQPGAANQHAFNHALAAQLFLQSPLMPQPSQWLYTQLYGNYNDMPWFRNSVPGSGGTTTSTGGFRGHLDRDEDTKRDETNRLVRRAVTLISHSDETSDRASPPVSSTRRSSSPDSDVEVTSKHSDSVGGAIRSRTPKHADVWRPY